jgi:hypothetical protein
LLKIVSEPHRIEFFAQGDRRAARDLLSFDHCGVDLRPQAAAFTASWPVSIGMRRALQHGPSLTHVGRRAVNAGFRNKMLKTGAPKRITRAGFEG